MIPLLCLRQPPSGLWRSRALLAPATAATRCPLSRNNSSRSLELLSLPALARRASSKQSPASQSMPRPSPSKPGQAKTRAPTRIIVYHYGMPRILFLGALKLTTVFIFGFFVAVVIPSYVQIDAPTWQIAGLVVASTIPFLAISYLTSPMVMWIHIPNPQGLVQRNRAGLEHLVQRAPPTTEVSLTTMGALGKPRVTQVPLRDLRPVTRRFGLVNYVRDVRRENADRKWYQFRAVGEFKIEDERPPKSKGEQTWLWYLLVKAFRGQQAKAPAQVQAHAQATKRK